MRFPFLRSFIISVALTGVGLGCTRDSGENTPIEIRVGHDFFPLETGRFIEYEVTETQFALAAPPLTRTSRLREIVKGSFTDATGQPAFRLERFRRTTDAEPWQPDSVWTARLETGRAVKTEGNVSRVKLMFPVREGLRFDGNALNAHGTEESQIRRFDVPMTVGTQSFSRTLEVVQRDDSSLVSLERRVERYARGVGLIFSENTRLFYCSLPACLGKGQVDFGRQTIYRIRKHGKE